MKGEWDAHSRRVEERRRVPITDRNTIRTIFLSMISALSARDLARYEFSEAQHQFISSCCVEAYFNLKEKRDALIPDFMQSGDFIAKIREKWASLEENASQAAAMASRRRAFIERHGFNVGSTTTTLDT